MGSKNRGTNNGKVLMFDTMEQRCKFVLLYKDLFTPYSDSSYKVQMAKKANNEQMMKQLLEGYALDPIYECSAQIRDYVPGYELCININAEKWHKICEVLQLKKEYIIDMYPYREGGRRKYYWTM